MSSTTYTKTEMKSHSSDFKSFIYSTSNVTGLQVTVYFSDVFTAFLRTSKRKNTAHRCPIQTEFRGTSPSFTRASFSKVSHFERERAQARSVKLQTIAHAQYPLMPVRLAGGRLHALTDSGSKPELLVQPRV